MNALPAIREESDGDDVFPFTLEFTVELCEKCGAQRSVEAPCDHCGSGVALTAGPVADRRAATANAVGILEAPGDLVASCTRTEPVQWLGPIGDWFSAFLGSLQAFVHESGDAGPLEQSCLALCQLEADLVATPKYRPSLAYWRAVGDTLSRCRLIADGYLHCLRAPALADAENFGAAAQRHMDEVASGLDAWREFHDSWFGEDDTLPSDVVARGVLIGGRMVGSVSEGLLDADKRGHDRFAEVTGATASCPTGFGLSLGMIGANVEATMDPTRFWSATGLAYRRLTGRQQRGRQAFPKLVADAQWRADMVEVQTELVEAIREVPTDITDGQARRISRSLIRLGHLNCERAAKYLMATVLAAFRDRDYAALRKRDFGALLGEMRDLRLDGLLLGIDAALRHADAHNEFRPHDDGVEFTCDRREYDFLTWDELLDRVVAGLESSLAILTAVLCAAGLEGLDGDDFVDLAEFFEPVDCLSLVLAVDGWSQVNITIEDDAAAVVGAVPRTPTFSVVGALSAHLPENVSQLLVVASRPGGSTRLEGPVDVLRSFNDSEGTVKDAAFVDILRTWRLDGRFIIDSAGVRKVIAYRVLEAVAAGDAPLLARTKVIRPWLDAARRAGDAELAAAAAKVLAGVRGVALGHGSGPGYQEAVDRLVRWGSADVEWPLSQAS
jgi:hypothetical protein